MRRRVFVPTLVLALMAACGRTENTILGPDIAPALACQGYGPEAASPYRLPYDVGQSFEVIQSNCSQTGPTHYPGSVYKYAYDFLMPIGTRVTAARDGTVLRTESRFPDGTRTPGEENYVFIRHADGTIARYYHLTQNGALVSAGDVVVAGDVIGLSGNSGNTGIPHLHFDVVPCPGDVCVSMPVTFNNTRAHPNGLVEFESYVAEVR